MMHVLGPAMWERGGGGPHILFKYAWGPIPNSELMYVELGYKKNVYQTTRFKSNFFLKQNWFFFIFLFFGNCLWTQNWIIYTTQYPLPMSTSCILFHHSLGRNGQNNLYIMMNGKLSLCLVWIKIKF